MNESLNKLLNPESTDFSVLDYDCAYLPNKLVRMKYKYTLKANKTFTSEVVKRGWRRFGYYFFHPICEGCNECKSVRIDVENYKITKSQKKSIKRNQDTKIVIQEPSVTQAHINLYNKYHQFKNDKSNWNSTGIGKREYVDNFVDGYHDFGREVLYFDKNKLIGVDLIDIVDDGISSIYFFYDPDYPRLSLGVYSLIYQIKLANILGLKWIYLGYWVDGCKSFEYKTNFKPQQILDNFPLLEEKADWNYWLEED